MLHHRSRWRYLGRYQPLLGSKLLLERLLDRGRAFPVCSAHHGRTLYQTLVEA